jgi:hypothetical protein
MPTATPPRIPAPTVPAAGASLALHVPNPDILFQVVWLADKESEDSYHYENNDSVQGSMSGSEIHAADKLVAADVQRHYANGLLAASKVLTSSSQLLWNSWPPDSLMQLLHAAAIRYVLDHPALLTDGGQHADGRLTLAPRLLEMDGDPGREWLVTVTLSQYQVTDWLVFDEDTAGRVRSLPAPWRPYYVGHDSVDFDASHDFTGDGRPEIVIATNNYMMGSAWGDVYIYHFAGQGWKEIGEAFLEPLGSHTGEHSDYLDNVRLDKRSNRQNRRAVVLIDE